jgi:hypothetical protein
MNRHHILRVSLLAGLCLATGCAARMAKPAVQPVPLTSSSRLPTGSQATNTAASPFSAYDQAVVSRIERQWYQLLDNGRVKILKTGVVVVYFRLHADGTVSDLKLEKDAFGGLCSYLAEVAIVQSAPFPAWPPDMVRTVDKNYREITFTFHYD